MGPATLHYVSVRYSHCLSRLLSPLSSQLDVDGVAKHNTKLTVRKPGPLFCPSRPASQWRTGTFQDPEDGPPATFTCRTRLPTPPTPTYIPLPRPSASRRMQHAPRRESHQGPRACWQLRDELFACLIASSSGCRNPILAATPRNAISNLPHMTALLSFGMRDGRVQATWRWLPQ